MFNRLRTSGLAGGGAMLLVLSLSGIVAGATLLADTVPPVVDTTLSFEDTDGNGVDDDCQLTVVADLAAEALAQAAVDLDGDGVIAVSEAAQSDRIGGENCNHGGYVSIVAHGDDACEAPEAAAPEAGDGSAIAIVAVPTAPCDEEAVEEPATEEAPAAECDTAAVPAPAPVTTETEAIEPNEHGKAVSEVAKSDAVGGKNCNHGGAVSEAAKQDKAARDAAKAAAKAERDAAKAERKAAHDAAKAARDAAKAARHHGKPGG